MRHYFLSFLILTTFIVGCSDSKSVRTEQAISKNSSRELIGAINVVDLIGNAADYDGKEVILTGTVVHVCKHSGKRLHLLGSDEKTRIRVEAGEIGVFDRELEGSEIITRGIFRRQIIDEEYMAKWENEMKKEGRNHEAHEGQEEEADKMKRYRDMMKEKDGGQMEQFWVDGISFEAVDQTSI